jgi:myosin heavy subunit
MLKSMSLTEEQVNAIIEAHTETVTGLKTKITDLETAIEPLKEVAKERDSLKEQLAKVGDSTKLREEFDAYKQQVENEKQEAKVDEEVTAICKDAGITRASFLRAVGREFDRSKIQRGEDGTISNREALVEYVKKDFADFGSTTVERGTPPVTPPAGGNKTYTRAEIQAMSPDEINKNWPEVQKSLAAMN